MHNISTFIRDISTRTPTHTPVCMLRGEASEEILKGAKFGKEEKFKKCAPSSEECENTYTL